MRFHWQTGNHCVVFANEFVKHVSKVVVCSSFYFGGVLG